MKKLAALSFVLLADLVPVNESLATTFLADELALLAWAICRGTKNGPHIPQERSSVLQSTGSTLTSISVEAYHQSYNALESCQHPFLWTPLKSLTANKPYHKAQSTTSTEAQRSLSVPRRGERMKESRN